jgi:putative ABC transport system substrate-binding protein
VDGLVASLARPGGNLTGVGQLGDEGLTAKRLELLSELVPRAGVIALLVNPNSPSAERVIQEVQQAARAKGLQLHVLKAGSESEIDAFVSLVQLHADALLVGADPFLSSRRERLVALASRHAVPSIYAWREFAASGGLISYGASLTSAFRLLGSYYAGKVLKGAKPADLPVQQSTTFELVINLKTAEALGLTVPQSMLMRADEVIE